MRRLAKTSRSLATLGSAALLLGATLLTACAGPSGQKVSASEYRELERQAASDQAGAGGGANFESKRRALDERSRKLDERKADLAHATLALASKRAETALEHAIALSTESVDLARSQRELLLAQEDLTYFTSEDRKRRLERDRLEVQSSGDRLRETREELAQLEMMYGESQLGDATAEIVVERTRRRLLLAEMRHALRELESKELAERTLPRQLKELEAKLLEKQVAQENTKRRLEKQALGRESALRDLDHEQASLERKDAALDEEERLLEKDRREWERSGSPLGGNGAPRS